MRDLAKRPKLRLVVAGPKVPIGLYTREVLKRLGMLGVLRKTVSLEPDVKGIVGKVALGEADAGFVYRTDVRPVAGKVRAITLPAGVAADRPLRGRARDLRRARSRAASRSSSLCSGPAVAEQLRAAGFGEP